MYRGQDLLEEGGGMQKRSGWDYVFQKGKMLVVAFGVVIAGMVFLEVNGEPAFRLAGGAGLRPFDVQARGVPGGVEIALDTGEVSCPPDRAAGKGEGSAAGAQIFLDGRLVAEVYASRVVLPDVRAGTHRIRVALVDGRHRPLGVEREVQVYVPQPSSG